MTMREENTVKRSEEITKEYFAFLDKHIEDVVTGKQTEFKELNQIAKELFISHSHLSDTIQKETANHPCHFYDLKIIEKAKNMLSETDLSIAEIARKFTYDPSNFSKLFKSWTKETPGNYRKNYKK
jgi:AraC family transcriptional regulator of adaptative response / methylphosphotriester-DNA alkyltransferase methyltransferase